MTDWLVGKRVGSYRVLEVLGSGAMATVYRAQHLEVGHEVAIKLLREGLAQDVKSSQRFYLEGVLMASLHLSSVPAIYGIGTTEDGLPYMVMELLQGESLAQSLRRAGPLPVQEALTYALSLARTLSMIHEQGVVHRDLKPANIVVVPGAQAGGSENLVKVIDFGMAKRLVKRPVGDVSLTLQTEVIGTPNYMAPEMWQGARDVTTAADIYALGCILFEMLCGHPPFAGKSVGMIASGHLSQEPTRPSEIIGVSRNIDDLVLKCLEKEPTERFGRMTQLALQLQAALARAAEPRREQRSNTLMYRATSASLPPPANGSTLIRPPPYMLEHGGDTIEITPDDTAPSSMQFGSSVYYAAEPIPAAECEDSLSTSNCTLSDEPSRRQGIRGR